MVVQPDNRHLERSGVLLKSSVLVEYSGLQVNTDVVSPDKKGLVGAGVPRGRSAPATGSTHWHESGGSGANEPFELQVVENLTLLSGVTSGRKEGSGWKEGRKGSAPDATPRTSSPAKRQTMWRRKGYQSRRMSPGSAGKLGPNAGDTGGHGAGRAGSSERSIEELEKDWASNVAKK